MLISKGNKMKKNIVFNTFTVLILILVPVFLEGCYTVGSQSSNQGSLDESTQSAYSIDELNNYGEWLQIDNYGRVWRPYVVADWMPFDNGHWTYASGEWTWVSYEPFGWIVYHYGNWYDDPYNGWVWIPSDNIWSPARVMWVDYDDNVGWAPLPPRGVTYRNPWEMNESRHWHVVKHKDFTQDNIRNYRVSNPIRNEDGSRGITTKAPSKTEIERNTGRTINEIRIRHEVVKTPKREIKKMDLPLQETKRVDQNTARVRKDVLVQPYKFTKPKNEKKPDNEKKPENKTERKDDNNKK